MGVGGSERWEGRRPLKSCDLPKKKLTQGKARNYGDREEASEGEGKIVQFRKKKKQMAWEVQAEVWRTSTGGSQKA